MSHPEMANRTNKPNRTFSRSCSVCSGSAPHRTEPNSTLVRFCSSGFRTLIAFVRFCSNRTRTEQYSCPFVFGKFGLLKAESRSLPSAAAAAGVRINSRIGESYYKKWPRKFGGTMPEEHSKVAAFLGVRINSRIEKSYYKEWPRKFGHICCSCNWSWS